MLCRRWRGSRRRRADRASSRLRTASTSAAGRAASARSPASIPPDTRHRSIRLRPSAVLSGGDDRARSAAGLDQSRIPVGGSVDRRLSRPAFAPSDAAVARGISTFPGSRASSGGLLREARSLRAPRRIPGRCRARAPRSGACSAMPRRRKARSRSRCSATRTAACRRCSMRGPKATSRSCASCPKAWPHRRLDAWTGGAVPHAGQRLARGRLTLAGLPFLAQDDYDRLLWAAMSTSCAARIRSSARNGRRDRSSGSPTRRPRTRSCLKLDAFLDRYARRPDAGERGRAASAWHPRWNDPAADARSPRGERSPAMPAPALRPCATTGRLASRPCRTSRPGWSGVCADRV